MVGLVLALAAGAGVHLLHTALVDGRRDLGGRGRRGWGPDAGSGVRAVAGRSARRLGLVDVRWRELVLASSLVAMLAALVGLAIFGSLLPALVLAGAAVAWPAATSRARQQQRLAVAHDAWPQLVEQIRVATAELGRSVPQALFEAGRSGPAVLRPAFEEAHREWLLSIDFDRTITLLKRRLADPTADAACETLLVAHQVGGTDLDARLRALVEDRLLDVQSRKDARARQAGVRFARRFVLLVPCGMALAGLSIGSGQAAYQTTWGQSLVTAGVLSVVLCWLWAGRLLKLPPEERVLGEGRH
jgi:tight adherence protein B